MKKSAKSKLNKSIIISFIFLPIILLSNELIIINEINYHSSDDFNSEDWIELFNASEHSVDISGWEFKDSDDSHIFLLPENIILDPGEFIVLCKNTELFSIQFPNNFNHIGDLEFGLNGGGELIRLFNLDGLLIDSVEYDDTDPWPIEPDGTGSTLELSDPYSDNSLSQNWEASENNGTPGMANSNLILDIENDESNKNIFLTNHSILNVHPNPFNSSTKFKFSILTNTHVSIRLYNN